MPSELLENPAEVEETEKDPLDLSGLDDDVVIVEEDHSTKEPEPEKNGKAVVSSGPDELLIHAAARVGLTKQEIASFSDQADLEKAIFDRIYDSGAERRSASTERESPVESEFKFPDELFPEDFDPKIKKAIQSIHEHHADENKKLRQLLGAQQQWLEDTKQSLSRREAAALAVEIDEAFDSLPETFRKVYGKGQVHRGPKTAKEYQERNKLVAELTKFRNWQDDISTRVRTLAYGTNPGLMKEIAVSEAEQERKKKMAQSVNRPTHRNTQDARSAEDRALEHIRSRLQKEGLPTDAKG
jgi:hypothetical protein